MAAETRKVQIAGGSTFTISLPKGWAEEHGIESGQRLRLSPQAGGRLLVSTDADPDREPPVVDIAGLGPDDARSVVRACYAVGAEAFTLRDDDGIDTPVRRAATAAARGLVGLEVTGEDERNLRCRDLLDTEEVRIERVVSRLQFAALAAHRAATRALVDGDADDAERALAHRDDAATEFALVERVFQRAVTDGPGREYAGVKRGRVLDCHAVAGELDRVSEHAADLARTVLESEPPTDAAWTGAVGQCAQETRLALEAAVGAVLSASSAEEARAVAEQCRASREAVAELHDDGAPAGDLDWATYDALSRTAGCAERIAERAVQASVRQ